MPYGLAFFTEAILGLGSAAVGVLFGKGIRAALLGLFAGIMLAIFALIFARSYSLRTVEASAGNIIRAAIGPVRAAECSRGREPTEPAQQ